MDQISGTNCTGTFLMKVTGKLFETLCDICSHNPLFLNILRAPRNRLTFTRKLLAFELHGTGKGDGTPMVAHTFEQYLWCSRKPTATLLSPYERNEHARVSHAGTTEEFQRRKRPVNLDISTTGQDDLLEKAKAQLGMEVGKIDGIGAARTRDIGTDR